MKHIVYIGTHLKTGNPTTTEMLSSLLRSSGWIVDSFGRSKHKVSRFIEMCLGVLCNSSNIVLIDTYSTFNFYYALACGFISKLKRTPYILILHGGNLPERLKKKTWYSEWLLKNASHIVSPSAFLQSEISALGHKVHVIPNPLDLKSYKFTKNRAKTPVLLWVRALQDIYNPKMAVEVLIEVKKTYPNSKLIMVGPDKDGSLENVKAFVQKHNIEKDFRFTGGLPKQEWLNLSKDADVFLNTSKVDNAPVSVIEAMALGLPVVSTNVGGLPFMIENEENGLLVHTKEEMTAAVIKLLTDNELYDKLVDGGREMALTYDSEKVVALWNKILISC
ncbi:MAG: hypothetical protein BM564_09965 [Bacteroidetes bacterium MedPE-SWsnd-G2]|nr:MAG: hypothetical protein BM564_09965 [Bacteroidetes bacterium MedPE-SWsnd-G2]